MTPVRALACACFAAGLLHGQAAVEAGLGAARAATSTAPAAGIGKSVAGALGSLEKTLNADKPVTSETKIVRSAPAPKPGKPLEDLKAAETGITYAELIDRFGPPLMEMTFEGGLKKLTYPGREGATRVDIQDGKVTAIVRPKE